MRYQKCLLSNNLQKILLVVAEIVRGEKRVKAALIVVYNVASRGHTWLSHVIWLQMMLIWLCCLSVLYINPGFNEFFGHIACFVTIQTRLILSAVHFFFVLLQRNISPLSLCSSWCHSRRTLRCWWRRTRIFLTTCLRRRVRPRSRTKPSHAWGPSRTAWAG